MTTPLDRNPDLAVVLCNAPVDRAEAIARAVLEARLAACVNIVPGVRSLYFWKGALCDEAESTLILKTRRDLLDALGDAIRAAHPYDTPEILVLSVEASDARYAAWVRGSSRA